MMICLVEYTFFYISKHTQSALCYKTSGEYCLYKHVLNHFFPGNILFVIQHFIFSLSYFMNSTCIWGTDTKKKFSSIGLSNYCLYSVVKSYPSWARINTHLILPLQLSYAKMHWHFQCDYKSLPFSNIFICEYFNCVKLNAIM